MAQALYKVLQVVAAFMRALFGGGFKYKPPVTSGDVKTTQAQTAALGDMGGAAKKAGEAAEGAGKKSAKAADKAKKAWSGTMGFDEVNAIKNPDATAGAGAGAGAGLVAVAVVVLAVVVAALVVAVLIDLGIPNTKPFEGTLDALSKKMKKYTEPIKRVFLQVWGAISGFAREKFAQISKWWAENGTQLFKGCKTLGM